MYELLQLGCYVSFARQLYQLSHTVCKVVTGSTSIGLTQAVLLHRLLAWLSWAKIMKQYPNPEAQAGAPPETRPALAWLPHSRHLNCHHYGSPGAKARLLHLTLTQKRKQHNLGKQKSRALENAEPLCLSRNLWGHSSSLQQGRAVPDAGLLPCLVKKRRC